MGQYYLAIILGEKDLSKQEFIRMFMQSYNYNNGSKLMEHSYINNEFVSAFEYQLTPDGMFYKSRVVWAGDYADNELNMERNLYGIVQDYPDKYFHTKAKSARDYPYIINHTKKQYVDKNKILNDCHPLPLLTVEGNGRGGGDYRGSGMIGIWARDIISVEKEKPDESFKEIITDFCE